MPRKPKYKRVLLKLSGESLCRAGSFGVDSAAVAGAVDEILSVTRLGVQLAVVIGGGNLIRARDLADDPSIRRVTADHMGMLGTIINALALRDAMQAAKIDAAVLSAIAVPTICEGFSRRSALAHLQAGRVVIFAGGTGNPFFTTDTAAALRAAEIDADLIVKATNVEGVYDSDPMINPHAKKYDRLTYQTALEQQLGVMDQTAFSLCWESKMPIIVCQLFSPGNLVKAVRGEEVGTLVTD